MASFLRRSKRMGTQLSTSLVFDQKQRLCQFAMVSTSATTRAAGEQRQPEYRVVTPKTMNAAVQAAEYAVRGAIPLRAEELREQLEAGDMLPFERVINCNIGNPQQLGQIPLTFLRQVSAAFLVPSVLHCPIRSPNEAIPPPNATRFLRKPDSRSSELTRRRTDLSPHRIPRLDRSSRFECDFPERCHRSSQVHRRRNWFSRSVLALDGCPCHQEANRRIHHWSASSYPWIRT